ncbi:MAG: flavin reductase family protein [Candidatus Omnitrophota bacterium]
MEKIQVKPETALFPLPVVLVTSIDKTGRPNIITLAWTGIICSEPPMLSISIRPHRYSYGLIKEQGEFTVNVPSENLMKETDICGVVSGRDRDKFELTKLTAEKASLIKPPLIKECLAALECRLKSSILLGTHEIFMAEILAVHFDKSAMKPGSRDIDYAKARPFTYNRGEYWSLREKIGFYGCSKE